MHKIMQKSGDVLLVTDIFQRGCDNISKLQTGGNEVWIGGARECRMLNNYCLWVFVTDYRLILCPVVLHIVGSCVI